MNYLADILEVRKQRGVSVAKLAIITEIPKDRIYKWESGVGNPKAEDSQKLQEWLEVVPQIEEPKELSWQIIDRLSKGIENMTEANLLLARKLSSDVSGPDSSLSQEEQTGTYLSDVKLSGKRKPVLKKRKGILKTVSK